MQVTVEALVEYNRYFNQEEIYRTLYYPETGIRVGTGYFRRCLDYYKEKGKTDPELTDLAIRSYNAGFRGVEMGRSKDYLKKVKEWLNKIG